MRTKYYHLTDEKNATSIIETGIKADEDGEIFVFTDMLVANTIARDQVWAPNYVVFRIDPKGITGTVGPDDVAELSSGYHRIITQSCIEPKYLKQVFKGVVTIDFTEWDYIKWEARGLSRKQVDALFEEPIRHCKQVNAERELAKNERVKIQATAS